jgi:enoyl-CoA hydratase/carnithine racemase
MVLQARILTPKREAGKGDEVVKRTRFAEWKDSYEHYKFELSPEGILLMQCSTNGGPLEWFWESHDSISDAFADIAGDRDEIKCVIHTGTGDSYNAIWGKPVTGDQKPVYMMYNDAEGVEIIDEKAWYGRMIIENLLAINVPVIAAVNGPCTMHSEIPLLMDIVLASEDTYFQDLSHYPRGMVPGDGQHVVWDVLVGPSRSRYFLLMGHELTAQEAKEWGVVHEVLPKDKLLDRAWEIAHEIVKRPPIVNRNTKYVLTQTLRRAFLNELHHGLQAEMWGQRQFFPFGAGMQALDRPWDQKPWSD